MIRDLQDTLSDKQAIQASGASTNIWDTGLAGGGVGNGKELFAVFTVNTAANAWTSIDLDLQTDTDSGFATALASIVKYSTILQATLVAGYRIVIPLPPGSCKEWIRGYYTGNGSGSSDTLKVSLEIVDCVDSKQTVAYSGR